MTYVLQPLALETTCRACEPKLHRYKITPIKSIQPYHSPIQTHPAYPSLQERPLHPASITPAPHNPIRSPHAHDLKPKMTSRPIQTLNIFISPVPHGILTTENIFLGCHAPPDDQQGGGDTSLTRGHCVTASQEKRGVSADGSPRRLHSTVRVQTSIESFERLIRILKGF